MKFLLIYATTEGQTRKIVEFVAGQLKNLSHEVELLNSARRLLALEISDYDAVIIAGSVHQRIHQESVTNFVIAHREQLKKLPVLFISVSLSIAFDGGGDEAQKYVDMLVDYTGFNPTSSLLVAGALRFDEYDFFMEQIVEFVVLKDQENINSDKEFTDWDKLTGDIAGFARAVSVFK